MKRCNRCGSPNLEGARFCGDCGNTMEGADTYVDAPVAVQAAYCTVEEAPQQKKFRYWIPWTMLAVAIPVLCAIAILLGA